MRGAVVLTRPEADSRDIADALAPIPCLIWPLTRIELVPANLPADLCGAEALVFTSRHGVAGYLAAGGQTGLAAFCVGSSTLAAAEAAGFGPCIDGGGNAGALTEALAVGACRKVLYPRGEQISRKLSAPGVEIAEVVVYRAPETDSSNGFPKHPGPLLLTCWSARAGWILARRLGAQTGLPVAAISAAAMRPLTEAGFSSGALAATPDRAAMLAVIREQFAAMQ